MVGRRRARGRPSSRNGHLGPLAVDLARSTRSTTASASWRRRRARPRCRDVGLDRVHRALDDQPHADGRREVHGHVAAVDELAPRAARRAPSRSGTRSSARRERLEVLHRAGRQVVEHEHRVAASEQPLARCEPMNPAPPVTKTFMPAPDRGWEEPSKLPCRASCPPGCASCCCRSSPAGAARRSSSTTWPPSGRGPTRRSRARRSRSRRCGRRPRSASRWRRRSSRRCCGASCTRPAHSSPLPSAGSPRGCWSSSTRAARRRPSRSPAPARSRSRRGSWCCSRSGAGSRA